jgi:dihydrofolate reductase
MSISHRPSRRIDRTEDETDALGFTGGNVRKIIAGLFISLDGVAENPGEWQFDHFDSGMMSAMDGFLSKTEDILLGRVSYQEWSNYWPNSKDDDFAGYINNAPKHVVSNTLTEVSWGQHKTVSLLKGPLKEALTALRKKPGKDINAAGSLTLIRSLIEMDELDELTLMIHPVIVGKGKRLFGEGELKRLHLVESHATPTGVLIVTYRRRA